jgi:branched-chain amino acid aminotransferase
MNSDPKYADGAAYLHGTVVPIGEACIPLLDTGFLRSDLTYDVVHVWRGRFFRLDDHLDRFTRNVARLRLRLPVDRAGLTAVLEDLLRRSGLVDAYVNMTLTRGVASGGRRDPRLFENRLYAYTIPFVWIVPLEEQEAGISLVVSSVERIPSASVDPMVKNFHWGDLLRGQFEAFDRGARAAVLVDRNGNLTEGPGFNIFAIVDGTLLTPDAGVLDGITRRTVLELAMREGIRARECPLRATALERAEEVFLTSTAGGVMPVVSVNGSRLGDGRPGRVTRRLRELYWAAHDDPRYATPVAYDRIPTPAAG